MKPRPDARRIDHLRRHRLEPEPDLSLAFLKKQFQQEVARPYKQLGALSQLWMKLLPRELLDHTRLEGLSRGVLRVAVDSSSHLYELDRLLRSGLSDQLIQQHRGAAFKRIQLRLAPGFSDEAG